MNPQPMIVEGYFVPPRYTQGASSKAPAQLCNDLLITIYCYGRMGRSRVDSKVGMGGRHLHHDESLYR